MKVEVLNKNQNEKLEVIVNGFPYCPISFPINFLLYKMSVTVMSNWHKGKMAKLNCI